MIRRRFLQLCLHTGLKTSGLLLGLNSLQACAQNTHDIETFQPPPKPDWAELKKRYLDHNLATTIQKQNLFKDNELQEFSTWLQQQNPLSQTALQEQFENDFRQQRTVTVEGWQLARSEALLQQLLLTDHRF